MTVWFVGVDLAWAESNPSGVAILSGGRGRPLQFVGAETFGSTDQIVHAIARLEGHVWIAIDAPVVVENEEGKRTADRLVSRHYGRFEAGAYPANLRLLNHDIRARTIVGRLASQGVQRMDQVCLPPQASGSWAFETYPHAAMVELFALDKTIKYKKGRVTAKRAGLKQLVALIHDRLPVADPPLARTPGLTLLLSASIDAMAGAALKANEDRMDALICAYIAAHVWRWGTRRNWALGPAGSGSIVLPALRPDIDRSERL